MVHYPYAIQEIYVAIAIQRGILNISKENRPVFPLASANLENNILI